VVFECCGQDILESVEYLVARFFVLGPVPWVVEAGWWVTREGDGDDPAGAGRVPNAADRVADFDARSGPKYLTIEGRVALGDGIQVVLRQAVESWMDGVV
jgi:hypothetical protein